MLYQPLGLLWCTHRADRGGNGPGVWVTPAGVATTRRKSQGLFIRPPQLTTVEGLRGLGALDSTLRWSAESSFALPTDHQAFPSRSRSEPGIRLHSAMIDRAAHALIQLRLVQIQRRDDLTADPPSPSSVGRVARLSISLRPCRDKHSFPEHKAIPDDIFRFCAELFELETRFGNLRPEAPGRPAERGRSGESAGAALHSR